MAVLLVGKGGTLKFRNLRRGARLITITSIIAREYGMKSQSAFILENRMSSWAITV